MSENDLEELPEDGEYQPVKHHSFTIYNFIVFALLMVLIWIIGQFTPILPDELAAELIAMLFYVWYGIRVPKR